MVESTAENLAEIRACIDYSDNPRVEIGRKGDTKSIPLFENEFRALRKAIPQIETAVIQEVRHWQLHLHQRLESLLT